MIRKLRRLVVRFFPWVAVVVYYLRVLINPRIRTAHLDAKQKYGHLRNELGDNFSQPLSSNSAPTVLFVGYGDVDATSLERFVAACFEKAGYHPKIVLPMRSGPKIWAYRLLGLEDHIVMEDLSRDITESDLDRVMGSIRSLPELLTFAENGIRIGKYTASTLMRRLRTGVIDLSEGRTRALCRDALRRSLSAASAVNRLVDKYKPAAVILIDTGYSPFGEIFDHCLMSGIPVYTWQSAHRNGLLNLKKYESHNQALHPVSLSAKTWNQLQSIPWTESMWHDLKEECEGGYKQGEWFAEVGTQFNTRVLDKGTLVQALELDSEKKTVVLFPHIFWDATFFWGEDLFGDYKEWFCECLKVAAQSERLNWIIKVHPANQVKDSRDGVVAEHSEITAIRDTIGDLPGHIKILPADTKVSTLSLFELMDYCLTVRGTIGIESACRGIPVLTAGTGRYDGLGFTIDSKNRDEYLERLNNLVSIPPMDARQTVLARRYAYGIFIVRATPLESVTYDYKKDAVASMETRLTVSNAEALFSAADVASVAAWIQSGDDDYCYWPTDVTPHSESAAICR